MAIISVRQKYESTESQQDYRISIGTTFGKRRALIDIGKFKDNFDKIGSQDTLITTYMVI